MESKRLSQILAVAALCLVVAVHAKPTGDAATAPEPDDKLARSKKQTASTYPYDSMGYSAYSSSRYNPSAQYSADPYGYNSGYSQGGYNSAYNRQSGYNSQYPSARSYSPSGMGGYGSNPYSSGGYNQGYNQQGYQQGYNQGYNSAYPTGSGYSQYSRQGAYPMSSSQYGGYGGSGGYSSGVYNSPNPYGSSSSSYPGSSSSYPGSSSSYPGSSSSYPGGYNSGYSSGGYNSQYSRY